MTINIDIVNEIDEAFAITCHEFHMLEECKEVINNSYGLKFLTLNIRSINHNFDSFVIALERLSTTFDVIVLTECWLQCSPLVGQIPDYDVFLTQNNLNRCGGVTVYVQKKWNAAAQELHITEAEGLSIDIPTFGTVLALYRSPSFSNKFIFIESLNSTLKLFEKSSSLILAGDININILDLSDPDTSEYLNVLSQFNLIPAITRPTRKSTCIDHIFVKTQKNECISAVAHSDITDHSICMLGISCTRPKAITRHSIKIDYNAVAQDLKVADWSPVMESQDVDVASEHLGTIITSAVNKHTVKRVTSRSKCILKPWMTPGLLRCTKHKDRLHLDCRKNPTDSVKELVYKRYRNYLRNLLQSLKNEYESKELANNKNNSKGLWKAIRRISNSKSKCDSTSELSKVKAESPQESANFCNEYFANVGERLANKLLSQNKRTQEDLMQQLNLGSTSSYSFFLQPTDIYEVDRIIMHLKNDSAAGIDGLNPALIKAIRFEIANPLTHVLNLSISSGSFPANWKKAMVVPIHKSGSKKCPENYRPISLLNIFSKILEKIVNNRLQSYLEDNNLLSNRQFGFRPKKSTEDAVVTLVEFVADRLDRNEKCIGVFLDLAKAFDTVPVQLLLKKMDNIGIRGLPLEWFRSYLTDRSQCTKLGEVISGELPVRFGVPQGSVLGPTLFTIFLNDVHNALSQDIEVICYADDTVALFNDESWAGAFRKAEEGMETLKYWLDRNLLTLNPSKTKYLCFHKTKPSAPNFPTILHLHSDCDHGSCSCQTIDRATDIRYLGIVVDENLSFRKHIEAASARMRKLIFVMKLLRHSADSDTLRLVYTSLGESLLSYCISVWGGSCVTSMLMLERAQRAVLKTMCNKPILFPTKALFAEVKVLNVRQLYILKACLKVHRQVLNSPEYPNMSRKRIFKLPTVAVRTTFAQKLPTYLLPHVYNRINNLTELKVLTVRQAKTTITSLLLSMTYHETETLLKNIK